MIEKLLGKGIAGRSGSYYKKMVWQRGLNLLEGIIQRHDDAYSELEAHGAASEIRGCAVCSNGDIVERLRRWLSCSSKAPIDPVQCGRAGA